MASAYTPIQTITVGSGGTTAIEFTSIPQTYTDLRILVSHRTDRSAIVDGFYILINGSTAGTNSNSNSIYLFGDGATAFSGTGNQSDIQIGASAANSSTANTFSSTDLYFPNYTSTTQNKAYSSDSVTENNGTTSWCWINAGRYYLNNNAITSIKLQSGTAGVKFVQYTTATLYGIKNS